MPQYDHKLQETLSLIPLPMWHKRPSLDTEKTRCFYIRRCYARWRIGQFGPGEPKPCKSFVSNTHCPNPDQTKAAETWATIPRSNELSVRM